MTTSNSMRVKPRVSVGCRFTRTPAKLLGISRKDVARTEGANLKWVEIKDTTDQVSINFLCTQGFLTFPDKFSDDRRLFWICCEARQRDSHARLIHRLSSSYLVPIRKIARRRPFDISPSANAGYGHIHQARHRCLGGVMSRRSIGSVERRQRRQQQGGEECFHS